MGPSSESDRLGMLLPQLIKMSAGTIKSAVAPIARMKRYFPMRRLSPVAASGSSTTRLSGAKPPPLRRVTHRASLALDELSERDY